jgi:hypothetical protein
VCGCLSERAMERERNGRRREKRKNIGRKRSGSNKK